MKIISSSKGGQKPFLSILANVGSVTLSQTKKILPLFLEKVRGIEVLVQRGEYVKMGTKMLEYDALCLVEQYLNCGGVIQTVWKAATM